MTSLGTYVDQSGGASAGGGGGGEHQTGGPLEERGRSIGMAVFGVSVVAYVFLCLSVLRHTTFWLLGYVADDAFYYLQIARHLAANGHSTFDGLNPTNGYHPGWMLLMTGLARLVPGQVTLLKASLGLEFGSHLATSLVLIPVVRRLAGPFWAWLVAAAWLLNPLPFLLALFGVEAPFAQFTVAVAVWVYLIRLVPFLRPGVDFRPPTSGLVLFGLSLAFAFYGRTDQALLAVTALVMLPGLIRAWTAPGRRASAAVRMLLCVGGPFILAILPWYAFSYASCGTVSQDSGAIKMLWHVRNISGWNIHTLVLAPLRFVAFSWLASPFFALLTGTFPAGAATAGASLLLLLLSVGALWRVARSSPAGSMPHPGGVTPLIVLTAWLGSAYLLSGLLYGVLLGDSQLWHLAIPSLTLFVLLAGWAAHLAHRRLAPSAQTRLGLALLAAALGVCVWHRVQMTPPYPWQRDVYTSQPRFEALVPAAARIGCFDAGIPAYFSPRTVINLDGLVNHTAVPYWKAGALNKYVAAQGIRYIANEPAAVAHAQAFTTTPIPLALVATVPLRGWPTGRRCLWKVGAGKREARAAPRSSGGP